MSWCESQSSAYESEEEELGLKFVYIMSCPSVQQSIPKSFNWEQCVWNEVYTWCKGND